MKKYKILFFRHNFAMATEEMDAQTSSSAPFWEPKLHLELAIAKQAPKMWTNVTKVHSCNAIDGHSSYFREKPITDMC